jgi:hypothetical protein
MPRPSAILASLFLAAIASAAGCLGRDDAAARTEKAETKQPITPEQARTALLKLKSIRVLTGGEDDPIFVDLKTGAIAWTSESTVTIGKFISCNLTERTWRMGVANPDAQFFANAHGRFECHADGTWQAIETGSSIS